MDIKLNGHSGCDIFLHKEKDTYFVIKKAKDMSYNHRLKKQSEKQQKIKLGAFLSTEIFRDYYDDSHLFTFEMQYIQGDTLAEHMRTVHLSDINRIANMFLALIPKQINYDNNAPDIFYQKINSLRALIGNYNPITEECFQHLLEYPWNYIMCSPCHGDLTLENMIVSGENIMLIDYLDSFYDSWMIDFAKILQDVELHWHYRFDEKMENNLAIRLISLKEILLNYFKYSIDGLKLLDSIYHVLLLNLLRIIPYTKDQITRIFLQNKLQYVLQIIKK